MVLINIAKYFVFVVAILLVIPLGCPSPSNYEAHTTDTECSAWDCEHGCGCEYFSDSFERTTGIGGTWHDRYIEDHCNNCPECCVELPLEESGCGEGQDTEYCEDCPGPECICVQGPEGIWWVNATIGDTEEHEDFGRYGDDE